MGVRQTLTRGAGLVPAIRVFGSFSFGTNARYTRKCVRSSFPARCGIHRKGVWKVCRAAPNWSRLYMHAGGDCINARHDMSHKMRKLTPQMKHMLAEIRASRHGS